MSGFSGSPDASAGRHTFISGAGMTIVDWGPSFATPPVIVAQPENTRALQGTATNFFVGVSGTIPISYQWRFYGTNLVGETEPLLALSNIQPADAGNYTVVVSNP